MQRNGPNSLGVTKISRATEVGKFPNPGDARKAAPSVREQVEISESCHQRSAAKKLPRVRPIKTMHLRQMVISIMEEIDIKNKREKVSSNRIKGKAGSDAISAASYESGAPLQNRPYNLRDNGHPFYSDRKHVETPNDQIIGKLNLLLNRKHFTEEDFFCDFLRARLSRLESPMKQEVIFSIHRILNDEVVIDIANRVNGADTASDSDADSDSSSSSSDGNDEATMNIDGSNDGKSSKNTIGDCASDCSSD